MSAQDTLKMFRTSSAHDEMELWIATDLDALQKQYVEWCGVEPNEVPEFRELPMDESLTVNYENDEADPEKSEPYWIPETKLVREWLENNEAGFFAGANV